jgi:hypothetical protein
MKSIFIILILSTVNYCCTKKLYSKKNEAEIVEQREDLKSFALCQCLRQGYKSSPVYEDISAGVYNDNLVYGINVIDTITKISFLVADSIEPAMHHDYNGKKAIIGSCIEFYKSKRLDSIVKSFDYLIIKDNEWLKKK